MKKRKFDESKIEQYYYSPKNAGAYGSPATVYKSLHKRDNDFSPSLYQIKKWMEKNDEYTLQKPKRQSRAVKVIVSDKSQQLDGDLMDLSKFSRENKGYKYLLVIIDVFSRFLWVEPLKTKTGAEVATAIRNIINRGVTPKTIRTDSGREFLNKEVAHLFERKNIYHHIARNDSKANYAERVILTIKRKLWRYFLKKRTHRYIDVLQDLVKGYNSTPHRSLNDIAPQDVDRKNSADIWAHLYLKPSKEKNISHSSSIRLYKQHFQFKIGDMVRVSYKKLPFTRGYNQNWSSEIYKIKDRFLIQAVPMYKLVDFSNEKIEGNFRDFELTRVQKSKETMWIIEKKIRKRRRNGRTEWLVKWQGWGPIYNQWIGEDLIKNQRSS